MARSDRALRPPDADVDLTRFPRKRIAAGSAWFRQHRDRPESDRGAWWFSSRADGMEGQGRFDLVAPRGTCYLASTRTAALNELVGPECAKRGWVDADLVRGRVVSQLTLPADVEVAHTTTERATAFRLTNELATTERYDVTQAWSDAFARVGLGGIYAILRFTPGHARGLALFGDAGRPEPELPGDPEPREVRRLLEGAGIEVVEAPALGEVRLVDP